MFGVDDLLLGMPMLVSAWRALTRSRDGAKQTMAMYQTDVSDSAALGTILDVPGLADVSPSARRALLLAAHELNIPVDSLALVIASESRWKPAALNPLPAGGLIQLTRGARLPGYLSDDDIRSIVNMPADEQITEIAIPFFKRFGAKAQGASPGVLYMLLFLPARAGYPVETVLGVQDGHTGPHGETAQTLLTPEIPHSGLTLGSVYKDNYGLDHDKKGYFTIGDVHAHIQHLADMTGGKRIAVDGTVYPPDSAPDAVALGAGAPTKTAAGCGGNWASFKTAGGCGNWSFPDVCGNWSPFSSKYRLANPPDTEPVKVARGPGQFANAHEVYDEPDVGSDIGSDVGGDVHTVGGPRVFEGWGETHDPNALKRVQGSASVPAPTPEQISIIKRGIADAVLAGDFDPPTWTQLRVGDYELMLMNEPIAVHGLRLPTSFDDAIIVSQALGALPITPAISDARWAHAKQVYAQPVADKSGALMNDPRQVVLYNARIGPNTGEFRDGFWKELVVVPGLQPSGKGSMAQYGFKLASSMFEHGGVSNHDKAYKDYSDTPTYVSRHALKNGVPVDLLDEYAAGGPLGGPLADWLVARLRGNTGHIIGQAGV